MILGIEQPDWNTGQVLLLRHVRSRFDLVELNHTNWRDRNLKVPTDIFNIRANDYWRVDETNIKRNFDRTNTPTKYGLVSRFWLEISIWDEMLRWRVRKVKTDIIVLENFHCAAKLELKMETLNVSQEALQTFWSSLFHGRLHSNVCFDSTRWKEEGFAYAKIDDNAKAKFRFQYDMFLWYMSSITKRKLRPRFSSFWSHILETNFILKGL